MSDRQGEIIAQAAVLRSSPRFHDALRAYSQGLAKFREAPRFVNKLVSTDIRWRIVGYLLYLDVDRETFGPDGGATYKRLLDICLHRQEASPRTLKTMLALLRLTGFVRLQKSQDGRSSYYRPTDRMDTFVREWLGYGITALAKLQPEQGWGRLFAEDQNLVSRFLISGGRDHLGERPLAELMPKCLASLTLQEGAFAVLLAVMLGDLQKAVVPSRSEIARRFGLSKSQVTRIVAVCSHKGLFLIDDAGRPFATDLLRDAYAHWVAIELAYYAKHMRTTV